MLIEPGRDGRVTIEQLAVAGDREAQVFQEAVERVKANGGVIHGAAGDEIGKSQLYMCLTMMAAAADAGQPLSPILDKFPELAGTVITNLILRDGQKVISQNKENMEKEQELGKTFPPVGEFLANMDDKASVVQLATLFAIRGRYSDEARKTDIAQLVVAWRAGDPDSRGAGVLEDMTRAQVIEFLTDYARDNQANKWWKIRRVLRPGESRAAKKKKARKKD